MGPGCCCCIRMFTQRHYLLAILGVVLAVRLALVLTHPNYLGVDGGAYLLSRNAVLGDEPTGAGFPRPPLAPGWLLVPFTAALGDDVGFKVWTALSSLAPIGAVWLLSGLFLTPRQRIAASALVAVDVMLAEMMVTGALPLLGFSLVVVALYYVTRVIERPFSFWIPLIGVLVLIPFVNQTSAGLAVIVVPAYTLFLGVRLGWRAVVPVVVAGTVAALLALPALKWYLPIAPNSAILHYPGPWVYLASFKDSAWFLFVVGLPVGAGVVWLARNEYLKGLGALVCLLSGFLVFLSNDETIINVFYRSRYLITLLLWPCAVWLAGRYFSAIGARWLAYPVAAALIAGLAYGSVWTFYNQARYSDMVTQDTAQALRHLEVNGSEGVVSNAFTMSLWIAALNKVPSPHVWTWEPPRAYTETDKRVRCVLGWVAGCDPAEDARRLGVSHVLVDERFPDINDLVLGNYMAPADQWDVTAAAPWLNLVYSKGTTRLWEIN